MSGDPAKAPALPPQHIEQLAEALVAVMQRKGLLVKVTEERWRSGNPEYKDPTGMEPGIDVLSVERAKRALQKSSRHLKKRCD